jgi:hypothetical protein
MKKIKTYNQFKESLLIDLNIQHISDLLESLNIQHDILLSSIGAEKINIFDELKLDKDFKLDLDIISDDNSAPGVIFINSLTSLGLKKSPLENSDNYQTFLNNSCRFLFIYKGDSDMVENPLYILIQGSQGNGDWSPTEFYKLDQTTSINKFYDKLTSRTVEINDGDDNYIYTTNNANEWVLQNTEKENDTYKRLFRKEEFEDLVNTRKVKVDVLG